MMLKTLFKSIFTQKFGQRNEVIRFALVKQFATSSNDQNYAVLSLYHLHQISRVDQVTRDVKHWLQSVSATGRFHINKQGVNCQLCFNNVEDVDIFTQILGDNLGVDNKDLRPKVIKVISTNDNNKS